MYIQFETLLDMLQRQHFGERLAHQEERPEVYNECKHTILQVFSRMVEVLRMTHDISNY